MSLHPLLSDPTYFPIFLRSALVLSPHLILGLPFGLIPSSLPSHTLQITNSYFRYKWFKHISDAAEAYKTRDGKHRRQDTAAHEDTLSHDKTKEWFKHISDAAEAYKTRDGKHRRQDTAAHEDTLSHDKTKDLEDSATSGSDLLSPPRANGAEDSPTTPTPLLSGESTPHASPSSTTPLPDTPEPIVRKMGEGLSPSPVRRVAEPLRQTTAENSLIEPTEVLVCQSPVLTAEPVLTPLEKLRRTDEVIREALEEKKRLVADILRVPRDDYDNIAELAAEPSGDKEAAEILLAAVTQANKLWSVVNEALRVTEEEAVSASASAGPDGTRHRFPGVPAHQLHHISSTLNSQLSMLLNVMTARDEERERLRQEVQRSREQLHAMYERQPADCPHDPNTPININFRAKKKSKAIRDIIKSKKVPNRGKGQQKIQLVIHQKEGSTSHRKLLNNISASSLNIHLEQLYTQYLKPCQDHARRCYLDSHTYKHFKFNEIIAR
ncbi:Rho guanyl-nucleotide exchange factor activity protein [Homalodisca vitripennis]|nr:Rho guanyl-nucleotide exchange factor activity protein [Homalodisca vitripennis]